MHGKVRYHGSILRLTDGYMFAYFAHNLSTAVVKFSNRINMLWTEEVGHIHLQTLELVSLRISGLGAQD